MLSVAGASGSVGSPVMGWCWLPHLHHRCLAWWWSFVVVVRESIDLEEMSQVALDVLSACGLVHSPLLPMMLSMTVRAEDLALFNLRFDDLR